MFGSPEIFPGNSHMWDSDIMSYTENLWKALGCENKKVRLNDTAGDIALFLKIHLLCRTVK